MTPIVLDTSLVVSPPCGGPKIRYRSDGCIELVEGAGIISTPQDFGAVNKWRGLINETARRHGIPPAWLAGIMLRESGGNPNACSPCSNSCCGTINPGCCAYGLMQLTQRTGSMQLGKTIGAEIFDPALNLDLGAKLIRQLADKSHACMVCVLAMYNAGSVKCGTAKGCVNAGMWNTIENCGYTEGCIRAINAAILSHGYSGTPLMGSWWTGFGIAAAAVVMLGIAGAVLIRSR